VGRKGLAAGTNALAFPFGGAGTDETNGSQAPAKPPAAISMGSWRDAPLGGRQSGIFGPADTGFCSGSLDGGRFATQHRAWPGGQNRPLRGPAEGLIAGSLKTQVGGEVRKRQTGQGPHLPFLSDSDGKESDLDFLRRVEKSRKFICRMGGPRGGRTGHYIDGLGPAAGWKGDKNWGPGGGPMPGRLSFFPSKITSPPQPCKSGG